jgi:hypothetical protein
LGVWTDASRHPRLSRGLEFAKQQLEKRELMGDRAEQEAKNVSNMGAMEIIQEAEKTQQEDLKAVVRMQQMVRFCIMIIPAIVDGSDIVSV